AIVGRKYANVATTTAALAAPRMSRLTRGFRSRATSTPSVSDGRGPRSRWDPRPLVASRGACRLLGRRRRDASYYAIALLLIASYSSWLIDPLSSSCFAVAISLAGPPRAAAASID